MAAIDTGDITYGTDISEDDARLDAKLWKVLARWADQGSVLYAEEAISKGRTGWTVSHDDAAKHIDDLVERLSNRRLDPFPRTLAHP